MSIADVLGSIENESIDRSRLFVPETFTPLYFTRFYAEFSDEEKRRYNQLMGLLYNEQFMFFETTLSKYMLMSMEQQPRYAHLHDIIRTFREDELAHAELFHAYNRLCEPQWYDASPFHFNRLSPAASRTWAGLARRPHLFPFVLWLVSILEERGAYLAQCLLERREAMDPLMVRVHEAHLEDEADHFDYDEALLECCWSQNKSWVRRLNAGLFQHIFTEYFTTPKRNGMRVLDAWLDSFPKWRPHREELRQALLDLKDNRAYLTAMYGEAVIPNARRDLARQPEFWKHAKLWTLLDMKP